MNRSRLPLVLLLAVGTASAGSLHGIMPGRHQSQRQRLHRFLRLRQRRVAQAASDPGLHGSLEPALGVRRGQQGTRARHPRPRCRRSTTGRRAAPSSCRAISTPPAWTTAQINQLRPRAGAAAARRSRRDQVARRRAAARSATCTTSASPCRSRVYRRQDLHDPTQVVAHVDASGLGLPDRDYYLKPEHALRRGAREVPRARREDVHARRRQAGRGQGGRRHRVRLREAPRRRPRSTTSRCAIRSSRITRPRSPSCRRSRRISTGPRTSTPPRLPHADLNVTQPKFLQQVDTRAATTPIDAVAHLPALAACCNASADALSDAVRRRELRLLRQVPQRRDGDEAALEALRRGHRQPARRSARPTPTSRSTSRPRPRRACRSMVKNILLAMRDTIQGLDWMSAGDQGARRWRSCATFNPKVGYPDKWKDYERRRIARALVLGRTSSPRRAGTSPTTARRSASRSTAAAGA